jgi:hypothetical protein
MTMSTEDTYSAVQFDQEAPGTPGAPVVDEPTSPRHTKEEGPEEVWTEEKRAEYDKALVAQQATREEMNESWEQWRSAAQQGKFDVDILLHGVDKVYSTAQAAKFFGRSTQWIYWGLRKDATTGEQVFSYKNGDPILPERVGKMGKRRFTLPLIREIALASHRRGNLTERELEEVMAKILLAEFGEKAFAPTKH